MSVLHSVDWMVIIAYFGLIAGIVVWVAKKQKKTSDSYFLAGRAIGLVRHRSIDFRFEYRFGASGRLGCLGCNRRRCDGALRTPCLVPAGFGMGHGAFLHALESIYDAGISGETVFSDISNRAFRHFSCRLHSDENRGGDFRRRRGVFGSSAGLESCGGWTVSGSALSWWL